MGEERRWERKRVLRESQREGRHRRPSRGHRFSILRPQDARKKELVPELRDPKAFGFSDLNCTVEPPGGGATLLVAKGIFLAEPVTCRLQRLVPAWRASSALSWRPHGAAGVGIGWRICPEIERIFDFC